MPRGHQVLGMPAMHSSNTEHLEAYITETMTAQYSSSPPVVRQCIEQNNIDLWLLDRKSFVAEVVTDNSWLAQFQPSFARV